MGPTSFSPYFRHQMRIFFFVFSVLLFSTASIAQKPRGVHPQFFKKSEPLFIYLECYQTTQEGKFPTDSALVIPVALVNDGKLTEPEPSDVINSENDLPFQKKFIEERYLRGPQYVVTKGGVIVDTLRHLRAMPDSSGDIRPYLVATADRSTKIKFDPIQPQLAGSLELFHSGVARNREATQAEREEILNNCYDLFRKKGLNYRTVDTFSQQQILISNIAAESDDRAIVYLVTKPDMKGSEYALTLAMRREGDHFATEYKQFTMPTDTSINPGSFIGQADIDGDGIDELVFQTSNGELEGVAILKLVGDSWKKIYEYYYGG